MNKYRFERDKRQSPEDFRTADSHLYSFSGLESKTDEDGVDYTVLKYLRSNIPNDTEGFIHDFIAKQPSEAIAGVRDARNGGGKETALSKSFERALVHRAIEFSIRFGYDNPLSQAVASLHEEKINDTRDSSKTRHDNSRVSG